MSPPPQQQQSLHTQHSDIAKSVIRSNFSLSSAAKNMDDHRSTHDLRGCCHDSTLMPPSKTLAGRALSSDRHLDSHQPLPTHPANRDGVGVALSDTPLPTAPSSPQIVARSTTSGASALGKHATTLDIPGLTRSKVSPDGCIAQRDVGSKLVIVMVGMPARGKSYITKKLARYLNWLQHDTRIFNVGERRRVAAGGAAHLQLTKSSSDHSELRDSVRKLTIQGNSSNLVDNEHDVLPPPAVTPTTILVNGEMLGQSADTWPSNDSRLNLSEALSRALPIVNGTPEPSSAPGAVVTVEAMDQSASFFDPENERAVQLREQVALATLDELLDYILKQGGSVGILDATNSTLERRKTIMDHIRRCAGPELCVLFLESICFDQVLLESNMRLKLSGPDYKDQDPIVALEDFRKRIAMYEKSYVQLGKYEEEHDMPYVQIIDVSRKVVAHQVNGFLASQVVYYLLNFNLSPRQIWISRHGESLDDVAGKIGGDAPLSENGVRYAKALTRFISHQRNDWEEYQKKKALSTHFPPLPGDSTPPNPQYSGQHNRTRNFCVWSSMLARSVQTVQYFDDEEFDVKQMRMLDEINAGKMEGMTYEQIRSQHPDEYATRMHQKMHYRYPGPGGEGYLDVINRMRPVIVEVERMTDHVLLVTHRSVARVLLAYFRGLKREEVAGLDVPLGVLYMLEPKPYGVEFKAYRYNAKKDRFDYLPNYELRQTTYY